MSSSLLLIAGLVLVTLGADIFVRGASRLARHFGVSPLVVGLTVVAFGTSAPEITLSLIAAFEHKADLAVGNVVGSNIFNILLILGLCATIVPIVVHQRLIRVDVPLLIGSSVATGALAIDGALQRLDGLVLLAAFLGYIAYSVREARRESSADVRAQYEAQFGQGRTDVRPIASSLLALGVGLLLLVFGARLLVDGAVDLARAFGLSELLIGLTIVAAGTSVPEVATSLVAAARGERDIAAGNAIGSCLFNLLLVLGLTAVLAAPVPVAFNALSFDIPVMIAASVACLPVFFTGHRIHRWEGVLFLVYYCVYIGVLIVDATGAVDPEMATLEEVVLLFVLPLTAVTLCVLAYRQWRATQAKKNAREVGPHARSS